MKITYFAIGFLAGFGIFILISLLAAHLMSECGLPAIFNLDACADDIARAGWPLKFYEAGGITFHHTFDGTALGMDMVIGLLLSIAMGIAGPRLFKRKAKL